MTKPVTGDAKLTMPLHECACRPVPPPKHYCYSNCGKTCGCTHYDGDDCAAPAAERPCACGSEFAHNMRILSGGECLSTFKPVQSPAPPKAEDAGRTVEETVVMHRDNDARLNGRLIGNTYWMECDGDDECAAHEHATFRRERSR